MTIVVLDPTGLAQAAEQAAPPSALAPRLDSLEVARVGFLDSLKAGAASLLSGVRGKVERDFGARTAYWEKSGQLGSNGPLEFAVDIAEEVDAVVNAVGDCGSCTSWTVHDSVVLERLGIPTVTLVTEPFETLARARCESLGMPDLRIVTVPHPVYTRSREDLEAIAVERFESIHAALTESGSDAGRAEAVAGASAAVS